MTALRGLRPPEDMEYAWPNLLSAGDPDAGDEALPVRGDYANHRAFAPVPLGRAEHDRADAAFEHTWLAVMAGEQDRAALRPLSAALGLIGPRTHDTRPPEPGEPATDDEISDVIENLVPDIGLFAPERVLGPFALLKLPRRVRMLAAAVLAFSPVGRAGMVPAERFARLKPRPSVDLRARVRAVGHAPPCLWVNGRPALPLGDPFVPDGPLEGLPDAPAVIGRAVPTASGWRVACALPLAAVPPSEVLLGRLDLELLRLRRIERRLSWEDLLRQRGEVLYRTACEWLWRNDTSAVPILSDW